MDFLIQNKTKQVAKNIRNNVANTTGKQFGNKLIDREEYWHQTHDAYFSKAVGTNIGNMHMSARYVADKFNQLPQPLETPDDHYSYFIKEMSNNAHLPQDYFEFIEAFDKQYVYYNEAAQKIYEVVFIDAIDADSSGTIGDHADDELAKILIRDMDGIEIHSYNLPGLLKAEKFGEFGSIYLGKDQILCAFRVNSTETVAGFSLIDQTMDGMILIKIDSRSNNIVFNSGLIETPYGEYTKIAETDYINKTIGFINQQQVSFNSSTMMQSAWTYIDYNWETSVVESHTGPFTSARKFDNTNSEFSPNLGYKIGHNDTAVGSSELIGAYHKDRGFGMRYRDWDRLYQAPGTQYKSSADASAIAQGQVHASLLGMTSMNNSIMKSGRSFPYNRFTYDNKENHYSWLNTASAMSGKLTPVQTLWEPLGFAQPTTSQSWSTPVSFNSINSQASNRSHYKFQPTLIKRPHITYQYSGMNIGNFASKNPLLQAGVTFSGALVAQVVSYNRIGIDSGSSGTRFAPDGVYININPTSQYMIKSFARSKVRIASTNSLRTRDHVHNWPDMSSAGGYRSYGYKASFANPLDFIPTINGLGLLGCSAFETYINYKDTYLGTSIDED